MGMTWRRKNPKALLCATLIAALLSGAANPAWTQSTADPSLDGLAKELARLQQDVQRKNKEIGSLLDAYEKQGGRLPDGFGGGNLTEEQRKLLAQRFQQERLGVGATLQDILDRDREIAGLQRRIAEIQGVVPTSIVAKPGDTHAGLVRAFLSARGLSQAEISRLMAQVSLHPTLTTGNRVWILLRPGQLGTWVTAGDSRLTSRPSAAAASGSGSLLAQRDAAVRKARALELAMQETERERQALRKETAILRADIGTWAHEAEQMRNLARAAVTAARYVAGSKDELRQRGVIAGNWIRGTHVQRMEHLEMLDLTRSAEILLNAAEHGLSRIEKVELYPGGFVLEQDYVVHFFEGGEWARVALLDLDKFKSSAFVIVLE
jgi:hypothetical protein